MQLYIEKRDEGIACVAILITRPHQHPHAIICLGRFSMPRKVQLCPFVESGSRRTEARWGQKQEQSVIKNETLLTWSAETPQYAGIFSRQGLAIHSTEVELK